MSDVRVVEDPAAVAADMLVAAAEAGGRIALAGGSTPRKAYERSASADFSRASLFFGDERCVPPEDERSNYRMARAALLDRLSAPPAAVHRIRGEDGAAVAAGAYDDVLRAAGDLDLVLLGLGEDGHTLSLFPGQPEIDAAGRLAVAVPEAGLAPWVPRVTLTVEAVAAAREVVFLVSGAGKARAAAGAFGSSPDGSPAARVAEAAGEPVVLLDAAAAKELG